MDNVNAMAIVEALAHGVDPISGEVMAPDSPYNHPEIIRALFLLLKSGPQKKPKRTLAERQAENQQNGLPKNHGLPWSEEDIEVVLAEYQADSKIAAIAEQLHRKPNSIIGVLQKQGVLTDEQAYALGFTFRNRRSHS